MSKVEAILSQLKEVAANPKKAMDDFKAETGKGAVGIIPIFSILSQLFILVNCRNCPVSTPFVKKTSQFPL